MMKKYFKLLTVAILASSFGVNAQEVNHAKCIADQVLQKQLEDPEVMHSYNAYLEAARAYAADPNVEVQRDAFGTRVIPVVFHILHKGKNGNISKAQIEDQLRVMNEDFNRLNSDSSNTPPRFWGDQEVIDIDFDVTAAGDFDDDEAYLRFGNRFGDLYGFYFGSSLSDSIQQEITSGIQVDPGNSSADAATAFRDAVNALPGFNASYSDTAGNIVRIIADSLGFASDPIAFGLGNNMSTTVMVNGSLLTGRMNTEFRLARKDPLGNCTEGIVRVFTSKSENARNDTGFKGESYWTATKYLNVWVINDIEHLGIGGTTLGYAQFPATGLSSTDGIAIRNDFIGTIGTGNGQKGRTVTHEIGHWLGLRHIWGDATCGTDDVADTPTHFEPNFGICGNAPGGGGTTTYYDNPYHVVNCNPDNWKGEMYMNYMDYSSDLCMNMFSVGQVDRMNFTLEGDGTEFSNVRGELVSEPNLEFTGTADPYQEDASCPPIADFYFDQGSFYAGTAMICEGGSVDFEDHSYNGDITSLDWAFDGGSPSSSSDDQPQVTYNTAGVYDVSLTATGANGSNSITNEEYVMVSSNTAMNQSNWGYVESFWSEDVVLNDFVIFNHDGSGNTWEFYNGPDGGFSGNGSIRMFNAFNTRGQIDELITPSFDLSGLDSPSLQFRYSGTAMNGNPTDELKIYTSSNCGESWTLRTAGSSSMTNFDLTNAGFSSESYIPNGNSPWTVKEVSLGSHDDKANVRIKFQWNAGGMSNNFYIDDITVSGSTIGVQEHNGNATWSLAPNPASNSTKLTINTNGTTNVDMKMYDLLGKEVRDVFHGDLGNGSFDLDINLNGLESGVYLIRANVGSQLITERLIVE